MALWNNRILGGRALCALALTCIAGSALAQPTITSLGSGQPTGVSDPVGGTYYISGSNGQAVLWTLNGSSLTYSLVGGNGGGRISADGSRYVGTFLNTSPQLTSNTATGVSPAFSTTPTLVSANIAATESAGRLWNGSAWVSMGGLPITPSLMVYGSGSSGGSSGTFLSPNSISPNGQFVVGQGYISSYSSSAGTTISNNTFQWRAWVYDSGTSTMRVLPTPFRTSSNTWRRRTGNAYAVSNDGLVIVGAQEHNVASTPTADPDGGRLVVWRWNSGTSTYDMTYLPNGVNGSGFPYTLSSTPGTVQMNAAGTIIAGTAVDNAGATFLAKWTWNAGTSTWNAPVSIGSNLTTPASWLPFAVTSCGVPPTLFITGMSDDGNTIIGSARYSTCGSFMTGGFIWTTASGQITDWYDYLVAQGTPNVTSSYGPIGDNGNPALGLPKIGSPIAISPNGNAMGCSVLGPQLIAGAPPTIVQLTGGPACVAPSITLNPTTPTTFNACTSSIILNVGALGTAPLSYQWYKDGVALVDGTTASGSVISGATSYQCRVNPPLSPADVGSYYAVVSSECASPATSSSAAVQLDPAFPVAANDLCSGAITVAQGTNVLVGGESPCGAYINDGTASCAPNGTSKVDRWYRFTPSSSGNYRIDTCGGNFDTVVTVYDSCGGAELVCNDNYATGPVTGCTSTRSRIASFAMTASTPYYIRVGAPSAAFLSSTSLINLSISAAPAPAANDACGSATPAVVGANPFDLTEASNDGFGPTCNTAASRDVWFTYTQPSTGLVTFNTCGTTVNTVLSISNGCFGTELACNDNANVTGCSSQSAINSFPVTGGQVYTIRVANNTTTAAVGTGNLTIIAVGCDSIDYNNDGLFPDTADIDDFLSVFSGGACSTGTCGDIDFNNDGLFPDTADIDSLLSVFSGGPCI